MGIAVTCAPASARDATSDPGALREQLGAQKQTLEEKRKREADLRKDVDSIEQERARINTNLIETAKAIQKSEAKLSEAEGRLEELAGQEKEARRTLAQNHGKIAQLLAAMQRMGRNPPPVMVTRREDALQMVRSAMLLASVFPELRDQAVLLSGKLTELATVMGDIRRESDRLRTETQRLTDARLRLDNLLLEKRDSLEKRQNELQEVRTAVNDLSRSVRDMNELITKLDNTVSERSGIAKYNEELAKQPEATAQSGPSASPAEGSGQPAAKDEASANVRLAMVNPGRMMPSIPFAKAKGRLPLPASGRRVYGFGDKTDVGATSKGVVVETRPGAQVTSPADGWVVYAGEFRSYHQLLIINAGGGYHIVLAGLNRITANVGQFVLAGEPVGTMRGQAMPTATRTRSENKAPDAAPVLYVEFRKEGRPVDPGPWWAPEGTQKVQG